MKRHTMLFAAALLAAAVAQAQPPAPTPEQQAARDAFRKACADDSKTLCGDKQGREMFACLRTNADKVSPGCKDAMSKLPQRPPSPPPAN
jgi:hypothetical protein